MIRTLHASPLHPILAASLVVALLLAGCDLTGDSSPQSPTFTVTDDLDQRIVSLNSGESATADASAKNFSVQGVIRVEPPTVKGEGTTASHLSFNDRGGDRVFVGYKIPGDKFGGGIDVLNAANPKNLRGLNSIESTNLDVQEIADDPDEGAEYVAGAVETNKGDASPSVITKLSFSGNSGNNITPTHERLSANVAKSVVNAPAGDSQHDLYVVTDDNSLYRFDANLGNRLRQTAGTGVEFSSIAAHQSSLIMLTKSGEIWESDVSPPGAPQESDLTLDGSNIDPVGIARITASSHQSSSDTFVFAALNEGGFRVLDDDVDTELFSQTNGEYTSVSATDESDYLYASRKNGTVEVYEFDGSNGPSWGDTPVATINTADFFDGTANTQSNQVLAAGDYLYIANSTDGLLVLEIGSSGGPPGGP